MDPEEVARRIHEAGHAVAAVYHGWRVLELDLDKEGEELLTVFPKDASPQQWGEILAAGEAAVREFVPDCQDPGSEADRRQAESLLGPGCWPEAVRRARALLADSASAPRVQRLAHALRSRSLLEGKEVEAIVLTEGERVRLSHTRRRMAGDWVRYQGPRGGRGWKNSQSGEVLYEDAPPGAGQERHDQGAGEAPAATRAKAKESARAGRQAFARLDALDTRAIADDPETARALSQARYGYLAAGTAGERAHFAGELARIYEYHTDGPHDALARQAARLARQVEQHHDQADALARQARGEVRKSRRGEQTAARKAEREKARKQRQQEADRQHAAVQPVAEVFGPDDAIPDDDPEDPNLRSDAWDAVEAVGRGEAGPEDLLSIRQRAVRMASRLSTQAPAGEDEPDRQQREKSVRDLRKLGAALGRAGKQLLEG